MTKRFDMAVVLLGWCVTSRLLKKRPFNQRHSKTTAKTPFRPDFSPHSPLRAALPPPSCSLSKKLAYHCCCFLRETSPAWREEFEFAKTCGMRYFTKEKQKFYTICFVSCPMQWSLSCCASAAQYAYIARSTKLQPSLPHPVSSTQFCGASALQYRNLIVGQV